MDSNEYKQRSNRPNAFRRKQLNDTIRVLGGIGSLVSEKLAKLLGCLEPLPKPPQHSGGGEVDVYCLSLEPDLVDDICGDLLSAEAGAVGLDGETTPEASHIGELLDIWTDYRDFLDSDG